MGVIGAHSLFEFPLWYLYFLIPGLFALGLAASAAAPPAGAPVQPSRSAWLALAGSAVLALSVWVNHDFYKVSARFLQVVEVSGADSRHAAQRVTWFGAHDRYLDTVSMTVTPANAAAYWAGMHDAACVLLNPLYQAPMVMALAHLGRVEEAERLVYIYSRLHMNQVDYLRRQFASTPGETFARLARYLEDPRPVAVPAQRILSCLR